METTITKVYEPLKVQEENYLKQGIKKYLQPLVFEMDLSFLKTTNVIALKMPQEWKEMTLILFADSQKKYKLSDVLKDLCRKYPFIFSYFLDDASYKGIEPFLFFDKNKFNDSVLKEVSLELASLLKEYNREFNWGLEHRLLNEFYLNKNYIEISLYDILEKNYKYAVYSGYFISTLCESSINSELELFFNEDSVNKTTGKKKKVRVHYNKKVHLTFQHSSNGGKSHEAISQEINIGPGYFSYVIEMDLVEAPMEEEKLYMNLKPSIRQWITLNDTTEYKYTKENPSVYIGIRKPGEKPFLMHTSFSRVKNKESKEATYKLPKVLNDFLNRYQISFQEVLHNTKKYVSNQEIFIGIPYKQSTASWWENYRSFELSGHGITAEERRMFYNEVGQRLNGLKMIEGCLDITKHSINILKKETGEHIRFSNMVVPSHIDEIHVNIFAPEEKYFHDFVECFLSKVKEEKEGISIFSEVESGSRVTISFYNKDILLTFWYKEIKKSHLLIDEKESKIREVYNEIDSFLLMKNKVNLNLFFIPDYHNHRNDKKRDPFKMIRIAFRQLGQSVQFINYRYQEINENYFSSNDMNKPNNKLHRFRSAFLDGLSKTGIHQQLKINWEEDFVQIGINMIKLDKKEYFCLTRQDKENVLIKVIGQKKWYRYSEHPIFWEDMLLSPQPKEDRQQWIIDGLAAEIRKEKKHVILIISADVRQKVPCLKNNQITLDNPFMKLGNVTVVRANYWKEIPDYYTRGIKENQWSNTQVEGLFQFNDFQFYSLAGRGAQIRSQLGKSRLVEEKTNYYRQKNLIELLIFKSKATNLPTEDILRFVHNTRKQNISFDSYTNEPQILYYIEQIVNDYK